jgi:lipid A 4'-phosphatase
MTQIGRFIRSNALWLLPLLAMAAIAPFSAQWDLAIEQYFYHPQGTQRFNQSAFYQLLYDYGVWPALITFAVATAALAVSYLSVRREHWRRPAWVLVLTLILGSGVIVNGIFKEHWGRPRPVQVEQFGGPLPFRAFYQPAFTRDIAGHCCRSFPCGHCSMGFFFFSFYFLGRRLNQPWLSTLGILLALSLGGALSLTRMAQGGHFLTDTLGSALIMWLTALAIDRLVYSDLKGTPAT